MPISIFCCYARKDKVLLDELKAHFRPLQQRGLIDVWDEGDISAGTEWEKEIVKHLDAAQTQGVRAFSSAEGPGVQQSRLEREHREMDAVFPYVSL